MCGVRGRTLPRLSVGVDSQLQSRNDAVENAAMRAVERRYDRVAWLYDFYDAPMNRLGGQNRRQVVERVRGLIVEVGIGTGVNLERYPPTADITGIDISTRMLARARRRAAMLGMQVRLLQGDVERLPFSDASSPRAFSVRWLTRCRVTRGGTGREAEPTGPFARTRAS